MQDAYVGSWARESHLSPGILESIRDLNHQFLDLAAARTGWVAARVGALSAPQRAAAAGCPYALFDLRFQDDGHWRERLQNLRSWYVADESAVDDQEDDNTVGFVRLALFYAWHVASGEGLKAQLLLGMNGGTAGEVRRITVNQLPALAATEASRLGVWDLNPDTIMVPAGGTATLQPVLTSGSTNVKFILSGKPPTL